MVVNDDAGSLNKRAVCSSIASELAPAGDLVSRWVAR